MKASQIMSLLATARAIGRPVIITGPPGVGKSMTVAQYAASIGARLIESHPVTWDATDQRGVPVPRDDRSRADWVPMGDMAEVMEAAKSGLVVWDLEDMGQSSTGVLASLMQILLSRRINGFALPDTVQIVGTTNRVTDRSAVSLPISALKDRAFLPEYECSADEWQRWAIGAGVSSDVIGYIAWQPQHLHSLAPVNDWKPDGATPRGWVDVSAILQAGIPADMELETISSRIGAGIATEFTAFLRLRRELPDLDSIVKNPEKAKVPTAIGARYAVASALATRATVKTLGAIETYLSRIKTSEGVVQREFRLLFWRMALGRDSSLITSVEFSKACADFKDITLIGGGVS